MGAAGHVNTHMRFFVVTVGYTFFLKNFPKLLADVAPYHRLASGYMVKEVFKAVPVREDKMCLMFFMDGCWRDQAALLPVRLRT